MKNVFLTKETKKVISDIQQNGKNVEIKMQHAFYSTLIFTNRNTKFPRVRYNNGKAWTMIPHLRYYCEIGTPGH